MHSPLHDAVPLQLTELLREHLRADLGNPPIQFPGAERAVPQFKENERLPLAADVAEGRGDRKFFVTHRPTYFLVSIAQNSAYLQELLNGINSRHSKLFYGTTTYQTHPA